MTLQPVAIAAARPFVTPGVDIVPVWPGKTLSSVYFASYEDGSTLVYHELAIAAALVRVGRRLGFAMPRLYVDSPQSHAGGHAIWGVPKELATFTLERQGRERLIGVRQGAEEVMSLRFGEARRTIPAWVPLPAFGVREDDLLFFVGGANSRLGLAASTVTLPAHSAFAALRLDRPWFGLEFAHLKLRVPAPRTVKRVGARLDAGGWMV